MHTITTQRDKSAVISVRIPEKIKHSLEIESENRGASINSLISQVLYKYVKWDVFIRDMGFASVPKAFIKNLLENVDVKSLPAMGESCKTAFKNVMIFMNGDTSLESFLLSLNMWFEAGSIQYREDKSGSDSRYIIMHELGPKWNVYMQSMLNSTLNELGYKMEELRAEKETLSFTIMKPK